MYVCHAWVSASYNTDMSLVSALSKVFPPPRLLTLPAAGVDISDASLKYVRFERGGNRVRLREWGDLPIPENTVRRGNLLNKDNLIKVLRDLRKNLSTDFIRVSLPEERAYLFETVLENVHDLRDVRSMVEFRLEENVPVSPRDAYFDCTIVSVNEKTREVRVAVAVYTKDTINGYFEACREAGFYPLAFEVEAQAIARAVVPASYHGVTMIVDFGQTRTGIGITYRGTLMFTSTIDIGGAHMSEALRKHMGDREEKELTRLKNEEGLLRTRGDGSALEAILSCVAPLKDELGVRVNYWNLRGEGTSEREVQKIILCGGSSNLAGLPEYLAEELRIETERASVWTNALSFSEEIPPITRRYSYGYATAIGLALYDFVNT